MESEPRIAPLPPTERDEPTRELLSTLVGSDDGTEMNIFTTIARHPRLLRRWTAFGGVLLLRGELPPRDRELLILRTAWHCRTDYEWGHHVEIGRAAGLTDDEIARVPRPLHEAGWSSDDAMLLRTADELHETSTITDATWHALAARYSDAQLIELCMVVGQYHLVAFTLNSLGVQREPGIVGLPQ